MFVDVNIWKHFIFFWRPTCPTWTDQFRYFEYPFFLRPYPRKRGQTKESEKNTMHYRSARKKKKKRMADDCTLRIMHGSRSIYSHNIKESASFASMLNSFTCKMSIYLQTDFSLFPLSLYLAIPASCYGHILLAHRSMASHGSQIIHKSRTGLMELVLYVERKKLKNSPGYFRFQKLLAIILWSIHI
jgi:hypothetical protein